MRVRSWLRFSVAVLVPSVVSASCVDDATETPAPSADAAAFDVASPDAATADVASPDAIAPDTSVPDDASVDGGADVVTDDATVDASDSGADAQVDADASDGGPQPTDIFVNASTGSDSSATGGQGTPFKTLTKAMSVATAGRVVWLEDGTWTPAIDAALGAFNAAPPCAGKGVVIPAGVSVRAVNPGSAIVSFTGSNAFCASGGATLSGFEIQRSAGGGVALYLSGGTSSLDGVAFSGVASGYDYDYFDVVGGAKVTMTPGGRTTYATGFGAGVVVQGAGSELVVNGGAFDDAHWSGISRAAHLAVTGGAKLVLNGVAVTRPVANQNGSNLQGIYATDSTVELRGATNVGGFANGAGVFIGYNTTLLLTDTAESHGNTWGLFVSGFGTAGVVSTLTLSGSASVHDNSSGGIRGDYVNGHKVDVSIGGSASVANNGGNGIEYSGGTFAMTGGSVTGNNSGIVVATALTSFLLHNATVTGNATYGVWVGAFTGAADLGTKAAAGNNTISGNTTSNIRADRGGATAVGNTWDPSVQGTDAMGKVPSPDGGVVELTGKINGKNFTLTNTGQKLLVADP